MWDSRSQRKKWRQSHLAIDRAVLVRVPIRYGRRSEKRGNTFTMMIDTDGDAGQAVVVPCRTTQTGFSALFAEAEALWQAEQPGATAGNISAAWGCIGVRFRDEPALTDWSVGWAKYFRAKKASPVPPVNDDGVLSILWPPAVGFSKNGDGYFVDGEVSKQTIRDLHSALRQGILAHNQPFIDRQLDADPRLRPRDRPRARTHAHDRDGRAGTAGRRQPSL